VRLGGAVLGVLDELGHAPVAAALRIAAHWEAAVGPELSAHAEPLGLKGDTLEVRADSSVWSHHLMLRRERVLEVLREALGDAAPTRLRVHVGP
jgi:predicted nucleic acid-binding Zn ribbon protein